MFQYAVQLKLKKKKKSLLFHFLSSKDRLGKPKVKIPSIDFQRKTNRPNGLYFIKLRKDLTKKEIMKLLLEKVRKNTMKCYRIEKEFTLNTISILQLIQLSVFIMCYSLPTSRHQLFSQLNLNILVQKETDHSQIIAIILILFYSKRQKII